MKQNPHLRVSYIDESMEKGTDGRNRKIFASVLVKYDFSRKQVAEIYRIRLPGAFPSKCTAVLRCSCLSNNSHE